jgi:hypothetical protein
MSPPSEFGLQETVAENLAAAFLGGAWSLDALVRRGRQACGWKGHWLRTLAQSALSGCGPDPKRIRRDDLTRFILRHPAFRWAWDYFHILPLRRIDWPAPEMVPAAGTPSSWNVPKLTSPHQVAEWLRLTPGQLDWYSGRYLLRESGADTGHPRYTYEWRRKRSGWRLLEKPVFCLKEIQRRLLREILVNVPPHEAVHSYRPGHSVAEFVRPHAGKRVVIRMDLCDFFPSVRPSRVHAIFTTLGYPRRVARLLTGLCVNAAAEDLFAGDKLLQLLPAERFRLRHIYGRPHLPQGAPTSPMLSNLCAFRLDVRLAALAKAVGADYTRYADDLAFSGGDDLAAAFRRFRVAVGVVALEEGFEVNTRKTRLMRRGVRQHVAGLSVNAHPNVGRPDYDRLKAILHNCVRHGPRSQVRGAMGDFRASLSGKVQFVRMINPQRGAKLQTLLEQIDWTR